MTNASKGHAMKRGTMMVLKRLLATALGALTLGALAAGSAFAQNGQIPAPGLYNNVVDCRSGDAKAVLPDALSTPVGMAATSTLEDVFEGTAGVDLTAASALMAISLADRGTLTTRTRPCGDGDAIGDGFATAKRFYDAAYALRPLVDGAEPTQAYLDAVAARDAFSGSVYEAIYAELAAQLGVGQAVDAWNALFADSADDGVAEDGEYRAALEGYRGIVINDLAAVTGTTGDREEAYGMGAVQGFHSITDGTVDGNGDPNNTEVRFTALAENASLASLDTTFLDSMFDDSGNLNLAEGTGMGDSYVPPGASATLINIGEISDELGNWNAAIVRQEKQIADLEKNNLSTAADNDRLVKLKAGRTHVQNELNRLLGLARVYHNVPTVDSVLDTATTSATAVNAYNDATAKLTSAMQTVENSVIAFETARSKVHTELTTTESYLQQLVDLRQYEKDEADKKLVAAGDNPAKSLTDAVAAAQEALEMAQGQLNTHNTLTGDAGADNPATALLNALLEPDKVTQGGKLEDNPADDDGQALINAISDTYEVAKGAADDAQAIVDELTGEGGQVSMNTAAISENSDDITSLDGRVAANEEEIGMDENGMSRIDHNEARSMENRGMIMDNTEDIATNAGNIMTNAGEIVRVEGRVDTNWDAIAMNQTAIADNTASIGMNSSAIADNANMIGSNSSAISDNRNMIGELSESLDVVRAGVAASMALAGMPAINGRGISIGVGSFDGESAFAVGFQIQGEMASFKVGLTSGGGATGASAGVGFQF